MHNTQPHRHSDPESRPLFSDVYSLLETKDMLTWDEADIRSVSLEALKLGGPLRDGSELFKDIQSVYHE